MSCDAIRLDRGNHAGPGDGCCLMEHVSVVAGERFGPLPRCTHPAVSALVTQINDRTSDDARDALAARADRLTRARSDDPALTWRLVAVCARAALAVPGGVSGDPGGRAARRTLARADRSVRRWRRPLSAATARRLPGWCVTAASLTAVDDLVAAFHLVLRAAGPPGSTRRDAVLADLLDDVLDEVVGGTPGESPENDHPIPVAAGIAPGGAA